MKKIPKMAMLVAVLLGVVGVLAVMVMVVLPKVTGSGVQIQIGSAKAETAGTQTVVVAPTPTAGPTQGIAVSLGERVVNLADPGGFRYIKIEIVLSLAQDGVDPGKMAAAKITEEQTKLEAELAPKKPEIQDTITTVLTSKSVADVSTAAGKEAIKQELIEQLEPLFQEDQRIVAVYFAQFLIQ